MDYAKLDKDAEILIEAANSIRLKIAELKSDSDAAVARASQSANNETITVRYKK